MKNDSRKPIIGIIGGIGSGKSQVANALAKRGAKVINADQLGHEALQQAGIKEKLCEIWGNEIFRSDGEVDRSRLGGIVFQDNEERRKLEKVVFPFIERRIDEEIKNAHCDGAAKWIVLDAAIMLETGWDRRCDRIVYVHAPWRIRLERLAQNRGWSEKELIRRSNSQLSQTDKASRADLVVDNSGNLGQIKGEVDKLLRKLDNGQS